jgi:hypothetical protein
MLLVYRICSPSPVIIVLPQVCLLSSTVWVEYLYKEQADSAYPTSRIMSAQRWQLYVHFLRNKEF